MPSSPQVPAPEPASTQHEPPAESLTQRLQHTFVEAEQERIVVPFDKRVVTWLRNPASDDVLEDMLRHDEQQRNKVAMTALFNLYMGDIDKQTAKQKMEAIGFPLSETFE